jgi:hypothetical protein
VRRHHRNVQRRRRHDHHRREQRKHRWQVMRCQARELPPVQRLICVSRFAPSCCVLVGWDGSGSLAVQRREPRPAYSSKAYRA